MSAAPREGVLGRGDGVSPSDLDAHRQVLEMARTIEVLQRDYELMQKELSAAYAQLRGCSSGRNSTGNDSLNRGRVSLDLHGGEADCCSHQREIDELRKVMMPLVVVMHWCCDVNSSHMNTSS